MDKYMKIAYQEALKAYKKKEVPVGAVIVKNNKVIAKGHNMKEKHKSAIEHAEIIAIKKASKKLKNWRLNGCTIYVTLEPCMMCTGAILQSRISQIIYLASNPNQGYLSKVKAKQIIIKKIVYEDEAYKNILQDFFKIKRK